MVDKIMFIIFPGNGTTGKNFKITDNFGKEDIPKMNNDFIPELKKLGEVKFIEPPWNNLAGYQKERNEKLYHKNINFKLDDLNIKKYCDKVYEQVKDFEGKFVLIGHSIGAYWVYYFSQKYSSRCLFNFLIDGALYKISKIQEEYTEKIYNAKIKDSFNMTEKDIAYLIGKSKTKSQKHIKTLRSLCLLKIVGNFKKDWYNSKNPEILKVKTISFRNIDEEGYLKGKYAPPDDYFKQHSKETIFHEEFLLLKNPKKYRTIYFINHGHAPYKIPDSKEIILNTIKGYLF